MANNCLTSPSADRTNISVIVAVVKRLGLNSRCVSPIDTFNFTEHEGHNGIGSHVISSLFARVQTNTNALSSL